MKISNNHLIIATLLMIFGIGGFFIGKQSCPIVVNLPNNYTLIPHTSSRNVKNASHPLEKEGDERNIIVKLDEAIEEGKWVSSITYHYKDRFEFDYKILEFKRFDIGIVEKKYLGMFSKILNDYVSKDAQIWLLKVSIRNTSSKPVRPDYIKSKFVLIDKEGNEYTDFDPVARSFSISSKIATLPFANIAPTLQPHVPRTGVIGFLLPNKTKQYSVSVNK